MKKQFLTRFICALLACCLFAAPLTGYAHESTPDAEYAQEDAQSSEPPQEENTEPAEADSDNAEEEPADTEPPQEEAPDAAEDAEDTSEDETSEDEDAAADEAETSDGETGEAEDAGEAEAPAQELFEQPAVTGALPAAYQTGWEIYETIIDSEEALALAISLAADRQPTVLRIGKNIELTESILLSGRKEIALVSSDMEETRTLRANAPQQFIAEEGSSITLHWDNVALEGNTGFAIEKDAALHVYGITLSGAAAETGHRAFTAKEGAELEIYEGSFLDNDNMASLIYLSGGSRLTIADSRFENNTSRAHGGVINSQNSEVLVENSRFTNNRCISAGANGESLNGWGGAIYAVSSTLTIESSQFEGNGASDGGAMKVHGGTLEITGQSTFNGNRANSTAGISGNMRAVITGTPEAPIQFHGNTGHALEIYDNQVSLSHVSVDDNTAGYGAGMVIANSRVSMKGVSITNNRTFKTASGKQGYGAGIYMWSGGRIQGDTAYPVVLSGNEAESYGGGICVDGAYGAAIDGITITGNRAANGGGIAYLDRAGVANTNLHITENTANEHGGGIYLSRDCMEYLTFSDIAFAGNSAQAYINVLSESDVELLTPMIAAGRITQISSTSFDAEGIETGYLKADAEGGTQLVALEDNGLRAYNNYDVGYHEIIYQIRYHLYGGAINGIREYRDENRYGSGVRNIEEAREIPVYLAEGEIEPPVPGAQFIGWAEPDGNWLYTGAEEMPIADLTKLDDGILDVHAQYNVNMLAAVFDANGGIFDAQAQELGVLGQDGAQLTLAVLSGEAVQDPRAYLAREGYTFAGWFMEREGETAANLSETTENGLIFYAGWTETTEEGGGDNGGGNGGGNGGSGGLGSGGEQNYPALEREKRIPYIIGFPDETVRPDANLTRAEVSMALFRLIIESDKNTPLSGVFTDVAQDDWYRQEVAYLEKYGILKGYPDASFRPNLSITRAEFTAVISRFDGMEPTSFDFTDVEDGHWAEEYIANAYLKGWITGYPDGSFRPEAYISRGEAVTVINRMLGRTPAEGTFTASHIPYTDLTTAHWAWEDLLEASLEDL